MDSGATEVQRAGWKGWVVRVVLITFSDWAGSGCPARSARGRGCGRSRARPARHLGSIFPPDLCVSPRGWLITNFRGSRACVCPQQVGGDGIGLHGPSRVPAVWVSFLFAMRCKCLGAYYVGRLGDSVG